MSEHDKIRELLALAAADALTSAEEKQVAEDVRSCIACSNELGAGRPIASELRRLPTPQPSSWLVQATLARNLAIDHLRRIRPQSLDEPLANSWHSETVADRIPCKDHTPLDHALAAERRTEISEAMAGLPMMYREVLTLRFEDEMKIEEIAQVTAVPVSTVKSRLRRSLEQLRYALEAR